MRLLLGDCRVELDKLGRASIDAAVCDPPYELNFMGKSWDRSGIAFDSEMWWKLLRVLKPGGHLLSFGGTRTYHRMACAIEDAGFEIRDCLMWVQGSGFPKSHNLEGGLGTALKPSFEPIVLARKPLIGTVAENVARYGTGALNIDASRIGRDAGDRFEYGRDTTVEMRPSPALGDFAENPPYHPHQNGRWPSNVLLGHSAHCQYLYTTTIEGRTIRRPVERMLPFGGGAGMEYETIEFPPEEKEIWDCIPECPSGDLGEAARYFYQAKVGVAERNAGCEGGNVHPTVKPIDLMRYLCRLITPSGGTVLDPFLGSGSTGIAALLEGFQFIGVEREQPYLEIAMARIAWWQEHGADGLRIVSELDTKHRAGEQRRQALVEAGQLNLLDG